MLPFQGQVEIDLNDPKYDTTLDFKDYLITLLNDNQLNKLRFLNLIEEKASIETFQKLILKYATANVEKVTNPIDKCCIQSLATVLNLPCPIQSDPITIKSEYIEETVDVKLAKDLNQIIAVDGTVWKRCAVSLLPLLTTKVKICPVSKTRIIDINKDSLNDYGWFSRTLLEVFNNNSIYCDTNMISA